MSELTEAEYLSDYDIHRFDNPLSTVDLCLFTLREGRLQTLLIERAEHPCLGHLALPGGFIDVHQDTDLEATARRILHTETGVRSPYLEQLETVGNATRDPRGWSLTVVYFALIPACRLEPRSPRIAHAEWIAIEDARQQPLAFDHNQLLTKAVTRLRNKVRYSTLPLHIMPDTFTLAELQKAYEIIMGQPVEKKAFRRRIEAADVLEETGEQRKEKTRPAKLYRVKDGKHTYFYSRSL